MEIKSNVCTIFSSNLSSFLTKQYLLMMKSNLSFLISYYFHLQWEKIEMFLKCLVHYMVELRQCDLSLRTTRVELIVRLYFIAFCGMIILPSGEVMLGQRIGSDVDRKAPSSRSTRSLNQPSQYPGRLPGQATYPSSSLPC